MKQHYKPLEDFNSLIELIEFFDSEQKCIEYFQYQRWQDAPVCPRCECEKVYCFSDGKRFKCSGCRQQFTVRIGTIFEDSKISLKKWFIAMYMVLCHKKGISSYQLAKDLRITQKTAWFMLHRIRFGLGIELPEQMEGRIDLDETFVGGKNKNRHHDKKVEQSQGRSFKDKTPVMGMLEEAEFVIIERPHKRHPFKMVREKVITKHDFVMCKVVPDTKAHSLQPIINKHVKPGSVLISDEWMGYWGLNANYIHSIVDHGRKQYVNEAGDTSNALEGFWTWLKRSYVGIYHYMSRKHLQAYVNECCFRYNTRDMSLCGRIKFALSLVNTPLKYKELINKAA